LTFLENEEHTLMGAKLKSKTDYKYVFGFFEPFFARLASKFSKSANMTPKKCFGGKIKTDIKKRRISC
jgi:hypothetical protein